MMIPNTTLAAIAAVSLLVPAAQSQVQIFGSPEDDRRSTTVVMFGAGIQAGVSISYSAPEWKDDYDKEGALDQFKGQNVRFGKNWWTSLDTSVELEIGGTKIAPGAYVLGLHYAEDGSFHIVAFDAGKALKSGMMPFNPQGWKGGTKIPMTMKKNSLDETHTKMEISLTAESDGATGELSVKWGTHKLHADVKFHTGGAKNASADKGK